MKVLIFINILVVCIMVFLFFKSLKIFKGINEASEEKMKEINKRGTKYILGSVLMVPISLFITFIILYNAFM